MTDIAFALRAVNQFIAYRRSGDGLEEYDEILAVYLKGDLDAGLPIWHLADGEFGRTPAGTLATTGTVPAGAGLWIRESFSLSGIWTLGWVDGPLLRSARNADARRDAILRMLAEAPCPLRSSPEPGVACPVFGADEPAGSVEAEVGDLTARYPRLMGSSWYRHDKMSGNWSVRG